MNRIKIASVMAVSLMLFTSCYYPQIEEEPERPISDPQEAVAIVPSNHTAKEIEVRVDEITEPVLDAEDEPEAVPVYEHEMKVRVTHYCGCPRCCGQYSNGSEEIAYGCKGDLLEPLRSIAADPAVIPYGTIVQDDEGREYIVQDVGGGINDAAIDVFVGNHQLALEAGLYYTTIYW